MRDASGTLILQKWKHRAKRGCVEAPGSHRKVHKECKMPSAVSLYKYLIRSQPESEDSREEVKEQREASLTFLKVLEKQRKNNNLLKAQTHHCYCTFYELLLLSLRDFFVGIRCKNEIKPQIILHNSLPLSVSL